MAISAVSYTCDECRKVKAANDTGWWVLTPYYRSARIETFSPQAAIQAKAMELCSDACALKKMSTVLAALNPPAKPAAAPASVPEPAAAAPSAEPARAAR